MSRAAVLLTAVVAATALTACGGDEGTSRADQSAQSIVQDTGKALGAVRSYHVEGTQTDADGRTSLSADVDAKGPLKVDIGQGSQKASLLLLSKTETYIKANASFWRDSGGSGGAALAGRLADRWVKVPGDGTNAFGGLAEELRPSTLAHCLGRGLGTLTVVGARKEAGRDVVVVRDAGDRPGTEPGELSVAADGPALPVRSTQTGRRKPGGQADARCQDEDDTSTASDLRFSRFDEPLALKAPPGALDLTAAAEGGATA